MTELRVAGPPPQLQRVLELTGADAVVDVRATAEQAVAQPAGRRLTVEHPGGTQEPIGHCRPAGSPTPCPGSRRCRRLSWGQSVLCRSVTGLWVPDDPGRHGKEGGTRCAP
ncbi:hypothetical protein Scel_00210 [Streptomyces cellostaticus]|nr:hypothetical protein Scel_00210 [Streptomyces cellostaticus]